MKIPTKLSRKKISLTIHLCIFIGVVVCAQQPRLVLPVGHISWVTSANYSPNGKLIVTASLDGTAKIWEAASGMLLSNLEVYKDNVHMAQFSPKCADDPDGGKYIVTASDDRTVKIWETSSGTLFKTLSAHRGKIFSVQFSPDGKKVLSASADTTAIVWDVISGEPLRILKGHAFGVTTAAYSPDGSRIVSCSAQGRDQTAIVWNAETGDSVSVLRGHTSFVVYAAFSSNGKRIVTTSRDNTARIWDASTGELVHELIGHKARVNFAAFGPSDEVHEGNENLLVTASEDRSIIVWDIVTGSKLAIKKEVGTNVNSAIFSKDGKQVLTASSSKTAKLYAFSQVDSLEGLRLVKELKGHKGNVVFASFSPNGQFALTASTDQTCKIFRCIDGILFRELKGHTSSPNAIQYSNDGYKWMTTYQNNSTKVWDAASGKLLFHLAADSSGVNAASFSKDGKYIASAGNDTMARIYDALSGKLLHELKESSAIVKYVQFSYDGKNVLTVSRDKSVKLWDVENGKRSFSLHGHSSEIGMAQFSPPSTEDSLGGRNIVTASDDKTAIIWDAQTSTKLRILTGHKGKLFSARYSADAKKIVTGSWDATAIIWDALTGDSIHILAGHSYAVKSAQFSPDGSKVITTSDDDKVKVWDAISGKYLFDLTGHRGFVNFVEFSKDGNVVITGSNDGSIKEWDIQTGREIKNLSGHSKAVMYARYVPSTINDTIHSAKIISVSRDNTAKVWDASNGQLLFTFFTVDSSDFLTLDKDFRFDGSEAARKLLYFTCGTEVVGLDQVKDALWVPNLAESIMQGTIIQSAKLEDLNVCGLTPLVEDLSIDTTYRWRITPRRGGLGETVIYLNGIEWKKFQAADLINNQGVYELKMMQSAIASFFVAGIENQIMVKAFTSDNAIVSRGTSFAQTAKTSKAKPNLFAVIVGISDYSGTRLDLAYSAKDAKDISNAISITAKKMLNTDGANHVYMYNLTTDKPSSFPRKNAIKSVFDTIALKAAPNDILLIFFAGHGVMDGDENNKQFYFLTAEASSFKDSLVLVDMGISMNELTEWTKPANIKAQKRILIFDACNSGQAILDMDSQPSNNMVKARGDDNAQQIKAIDKLNEKSGMFILSASASNQSAFELDRYSQGLLTYSLLKAILQQPDILVDGKFIDIGRWFSAAERSVNELAKENGVKQQPQIISNTNFNLGLVDKEVQSTITIEKGKPLFAASMLQNADEEIAADNLGLNKMVNDTLLYLASAGSGSFFAFAPGTNSPDAYYVSGRYVETNDSVSVVVRISFQNKTLPVKIPIKSPRDKLPELASLIARKVEAWIANQH